MLPMILKIFLHLYYKHDKIVYLDKKKLIENLLNKNSILIYFTYITKINAKLKMLKQKSKHINTFY